MDEWNLFRFLLLPVIASIALQAGCQKDQSSWRDTAIKELSAIGTEPGSWSEAVAINGGNAGFEHPVSVNADILPTASNLPIIPHNAAETVKSPKRLWASSYIWCKAPAIEVEKWLSDKPETEGKYVLVEIWTTWCSQCARSVGDLNALHDKYADDLVIIGITDEPEEKVVNFRGPKLNYYSGIDSQSRVKNQLGVRGYPHIIIIEPGGYVVWEGFPYLSGHELTEDTIEKILAVGKQNGEVAEVTSE